MHLDCVPQMSREPVEENIPASIFVSRLIEVNFLTAFGFDRFLFFPGMLFNAKEKWWGKGGLRAASHEGLDWCFFAGTDGEKFRLDETIQVPMVYDGNIVKIMDDFLGKTVVTRHDFGNTCPGTMLSLYGHTQPDPHLQIGDRIKRGEVFARIADISNRSKLLPPHLHISLAKAWMLPPAEELTWEMLNGVDRSVFMDPLVILNVNYSVMDNDGAMNFSELYSNYAKISEKGGWRGKPKTG